MGGKNTLGGAAEEPPHSMSRDYAQSRAAPSTMSFNLTPKFERAALGSISFGQSPLYILRVIDNLIPESEIKGRKLNQCAEIPRKRT